MIVPLGLPSFAEALRAGSEIFHTLRGALKDAGHNTNVGDEGGFAPNLPSAEAALDFVLAAIGKSGYHAGKDVALLMFESLRVLERAQFCARIDADIGITAHPDEATGGKVVARRENAITEIGFGHFEGRSYQGLIRHMTLCQLVLLFAAEQTDRLRGEKSGGDSRTGMSGVERTLRDVIPAETRNAPTATYERRDPVSSDTKQTGDRVPQKASA